MIPANGMHDLHITEIQRSSSIFLPRQYGSIFIHFYTASPVKRSITVVQCHLRSPKFVPFDSCVRFPISIFYISHIFYSFWHTATKTKEISVIGERYTVRSATEIALHTSVCNVLNMWVNRGLFADLQGYHSPDNVKFPDNSLTVRCTPPQHSAW